MAAPTSGYNPSLAPSPHMRIPFLLPMQANGNLLPWTVDHWYYLYELTDNAGVLCNILDGSAFNTSGINLYFRTQVDAGYHIGYANSNLRVSTPVIGAWTHVAWVWNGTQGQIWVNGAMIGSGNVSMTSGGVTSSFWHSNFNSIGQPPINGEISRLRFWRKALTEAEILHSMNTEVMGNQNPDLIAEYLMDNGTDLELPTVANIPAELLGNSTPTMKSVIGVVTDQSGNPAKRKVLLVERTHGRVVGRTESLPSTGEYLIQTPYAGDHSRIVIAEDAGTPGPADPVLPDLINRVIPG